MLGNEYNKRAMFAACTFALTALAGSAAAQTSAPPSTSGGNQQQMSQDARDAADQVDQAVQVVRQMEQDQGMRQLLQNAQGVFIVPEYGRAALGVGASGGQGVLLVKQNGQWGNPAFYNMGGISGGLQAGVEAGDVAFVLNNQRAVKSFMQENNWSLNADAGLTVVNWSARGQAAAGKGDVVAWSETEGLFGDLAVSVTDINFDEDETAAYYGRQVALNDIFGARVQNPHARRLQQALAGTATATGGARASGGAGSQGASGGLEGLSERGNVEEGVTEGSSGQGADSSGGTIEQGAAKAGNAVERGAKEAGRAIKEGASKAGNWIERETTGNGGS